MKYPIHRQGDPAKPYTLYTDASGIAIGAILTQKEDNKEYVVEYASRLLKKGEVHYGISEKEGLALVWSVKHFRIYLHGEKFTIVTDHAALYWLMHLKEATNRLARWSMYIQTFTFEIIHRKGKNHANVDCLSRPVTETAMLIVEDNEDGNTSERNLDPYEDGALLHYLINGKHKQGSSSRVVKRVTRDAGKYRYDGSIIYLKKDKLELKIPEKEDRIDIITKAHVLGHFQTQSQRNI